MTTRQMDIRRIDVPRDVLDIVPATMARRAGILPVALENNTLWVVLRDDFDPAAISRVEARSGLTVRQASVSDDGAVETAIRRYYPETDGENTDGAIGQLQEIISHALQNRASDIHFDPRRDDYCVRLRTDGLLRMDQTVERDVAEELISAVKVRAGLDIAEQRIPQDGQMKMEVAAEELNMRVATLPAVRGEKLTLRLLGSGTQEEELAQIDRLGMSDAHLKMYRKALDNPQGVILLTGPTGSGKTTTLYASLRHLREDGTCHILSIEDPVEIPISGINQVQVDPDGERITFGSALRSALRHDPDVLMVGEIRDEESSDIAIKSALTGHLVLSTVHANSSANAATRLMDMGVSPFLLGSAVLLIVAQRLVRRPCPQCVTYRKMTDQERVIMGVDEDQMQEIAEPRGCSYCRNTGYAGRIGLYEIFPIDAAVRTMLMDGANEEELAQEVFQRRQLPTLREDGMRKVLDKKTTLEEVNRVTYMGVTD